MNRALVKRHLHSHRGLHHFLSHPFPNLGLLLLGIFRKFRILKKFNGCDFDHVTILQTFVLWNPEVFYKWSLWSAVADIFRQLIKSYKYAGISSESLFHFLEFVSHFVILEVLALCSRCCIFDSLDKVARTAFEGNFAAIPHDLSSAWISFCLASSKLSTTAFSHSFWILPFYPGLEDAKNTPHWAILHWFLFAADFRSYTFASITTNKI